MVSGANGMRHNARLLTQTIALGGHINPNPRGTEAPPRNQRPQVQGFSGRSGGDRSWDHFKQIILEENGGRVPVAPPAGQKVPPRSKDTIKEDLVIASRILASPDSGILDALGHVSVRNPNNPNHYFISRAVSAGSITVSDIIENDLDSRAVGGPRDDEFQEIYLHGEIYKARPDVMAVVHAHTPEMVAFSQIDVALGLVYNGASFIGNNLKNWVVGKYDLKGTIVSNPMLGHALAESLGRTPLFCWRGTASRSPLRRSTTWSATRATCASTHKSRSKRSCCAVASTLWRLRRLELREMQALACRPPTDPAAAAVSLNERGSTGGRRFV